MADLLASSSLRGASYLLLAIAAVAIARHIRHEGRPTWSPGGGGWWLVAAAGLALVGIAEVTGIGAIVVRGGRAVARGTGWYSRRRWYQVPMLGLVTIAWLIGVAHTTVRARHRRRDLAALGSLATLATYIGVRSASLHQIDGVIDDPLVADVTISITVEWVLIATCAIVLALRIARPGGAAGSVSFPLPEQSSRSEPV